MRIAENCPAGVDFICSSDRGGLQGETTHGHPGDPGNFGVRVQAETPGPPARDVAIAVLAPADQDKDRLDWKGAQRQKCIYWCAPDSKSNRAFAFLDDLKRDTARQIRPANHRLENFGH